MLAFREASGRLPLEEYLSHGMTAGIRWTQIRAAVLHSLWSAGTPLGAYETAERLSKPERQVHATSVYRCLRCFADAGLVVPIVVWKKYLISPNPSVRAWGVLLCKSCGSGSTIDLSRELGPLSKALETRCFVPRIFAAECEGRCGECSGALAPA